MDNKNATFFRPPCTINVISWTKSNNVITVPYLTLPYLRGRQALTPAQRWDRISSAQCASPNVTRRLQVAAIKP